MCLAFHEYVVLVKFNKIYWDFAVPLKQKTNKIQSSFVGFLIVGGYDGLHTTKYNVFSL